MLPKIDYIEKYWPTPAEFEMRGVYKPIAYWVPIELREIALAAYRVAGIKARLRYRGPRSVSIGRTMIGVNGHEYKRTRNRAMQDCLLADATHFTVYDYSHQELTWK